MGKDSKRMPVIPKRMQRRHLLCRVGAGAVAALAGGGVATTAAGESTASADSIERAFLVVHNGSCGGANEATVECRSDSPLVTVPGTILGRNSCRTAVLENAVYDDRSGSLRVVIGTEVDDRDSRGLCRYCIYGIDYEAVVAPRGPPETVVVVHRGVGGETVVAREQCGDASSR